MFLRGITMSMYFWLRLTIYQNSESVSKVFKGGDYFAHIRELFGVEIEETTLAAFLWFDLKWNLGRGGGRCRSLLGLGF